MNAIERKTLRDIMTVTSVSDPDANFDTVMETVARWMPEDRGLMYRATVFTSGKVELESFDPLPVRKSWEGVYDLGGEPKWIAARIAALSILNLPPPPQPVEGVGMRINEWVFWIVAPGHR